MRTTITLAVLISLGLIPWAQSSAPGAGERLYRQGVLPSAQPLRGERKAAGSTQSTTEACVNCHRPSGLGTYEGRILVPPVTAKYLFNERTPPNHQMHESEGATTVLHRKPYTDESLAVAIRDGVSADGRRLSYLMPRYHLDDDTMASLISYLKGLSKGPEPGVGIDTLQFATIITPDADPAGRKGMLDVLNHYFASKNTFYDKVAPPLQRSDRIRFRLERKWQLHVWELAGPPETWEEQLMAHLRAEPVFAVISGIGKKSWEPVHRFCQEAGVPCILPNVDLPVVAETDFYNLYFSKGVVLESQLIAHQLQEKPGKAQPHRVIQVFRADDIGAGAAGALHDAVPKGLKIENRMLPA